MAKSKKEKAVVSSNVEAKVEEQVEAKVEEQVVASVETVLIDGIGVVEITTSVDKEESAAEEPAVEQPSMLASMLQQEVKPLEEVKEETKVEEAKPKVEKNQGVGAFVRKLIAEGLTNVAILEIVHEQYGNTNTTYACVAWYRNKMKKAGQTAKTKSALGVVEEMLKNVEAEVQTSAPEEQD